LLLSLFSPVIDAVVGLFAGVLLLRFWMQAVRVRPPQSIAEFIFFVTDWMVKPLRMVIPGVGGLDLASLVGSYLVALISLTLRLWLVDGYFSVAIFVLALLMVLQWVIYGLTALLVIEVIFSWVNPNAPLAPLVRALNMPLLRPIRRFVPLLGGMDLSPMVLFLLLQFAGKMVLMASITGM
jgi:YggT family protein